MLSHLPTWFYQLEVVVAIVMFGISIYLMVKTYEEER